LEKKYILPDKANLNFARRITGDGKIGLFDDRGGMQGYFELGTLSDAETQKQVEMLEVVRELLFTDSETPDDIRQQFLADYTDFYGKVFGEFGNIRLSDLSL